MKIWAAQRVLLHKSSSETLRMLEEMYGKAELKIMQVA
jgi:hypothetical protein